MGPMLTCRDALKLRTGRVCYGDTIDVLTLIFVWTPMLLSEQALGHQEHKSHPECEKESIQVR